MSKDKNAVALGRKGGKARAVALSAERRKEIARQGYKASSLSDKHKAGQSSKTGENKV